MVGIKLRSIQFRVPTKHLVRTGLVVTVERNLSMENLHANDSKHVIQDLEMETDEVIKHLSSYLYTVHCA